MTERIQRRKFLRQTGGFAAGSVLFGGSVGLVSACSPKNSGFSSIPWKQMLDSYSMQWTTLPSDLMEAPHFGNGLLGSMVWIEDNQIRLQVFRSDIHDHGDHTYGWTAYSRPRYQVGYFLLSPDSRITGCNLVQDLYNAELSGELFTEKGSVQISHFVHRIDDLIYTALTPTGQEQLSAIRWVPFPAKGSRGGSPGSEGYGQAYAPYQEIRNPENEIQELEPIRSSHQKLTTGGSYTTAWSEEVGESGGKVLLTTIQNSYPKAHSLQESIRKIREGKELIRHNLTQWKRQHQHWWHAYYPESFVHFPDENGRAFYWNNVYRLACCTRPDAQYIDTPGMWNTGGPWPYSTHDFNTQTAHFPVYTANRLHLGEALVNNLKRNQNQLISNVVPEEWQEDSALLPLATAFDLQGKRDGDGRYRDMIGCLPWLLNNIWLHYRYTMDEEILKDPLFPLLRRSINLYRHLLFEGADGKLHLPPTFSPEMGNFSDCNFDLALIRWGCKRLIAICELLHRRDPLIPEWNRILDNLVEYAVDERGYRLGPERSAPANHQHMSHLMMIYPLYLETIDQTSDFEVLERSLRNFDPPTALPRMAASQSSPAAAALGLGDLALERMNQILYGGQEHDRLGKNGMYYLSTPCIETGLAYNTCVQDMLLQSWGNKIRVFPALPDDWQEVEFQNFRTEGAFLVSAKRENGLTTLVKIESLRGGQIEIDPGMGNGFELVNLKPGESKRWKNEKV